MEELTAAYYNQVGFRAEETPFGPDGGVDVILTRELDPKPAGYVQCKAWHGARKVGVKEVRELLGVMTAKQVPLGAFVTTGDYTDEARAFAQGQPLTLIDGPELARRLTGLSTEVQRQIVERVWRDDYATPTCPSCGTKMVLNTPANPFWGCRNFPRCKSKIPWRKL